MSVFTVCYDLSISPPTYDVVSFLVMADAVRKRLQRSRLKVFISPGPKDGFRSDNCWPKRIEEKERLLHSIVIPMCRMAGEVEIEKPHSPMWGIGERRHGTEFFIEGFRAGGRIRSLATVPENSRLVTITLREADHWPERNSNVAEWLEAACQIEDMGYDVLFVRDTRCATMPLPGFACDVGAAIDVERRAALYRSAYCNLFVANGPALFSFALDAPSIMVKPATESLGWDYSCAMWEYRGLKRGCSLSDRQRVAWEEDTAPAIVKAFKEWTLRN